MFLINYNIYSICFIIGILLNLLFVYIETRKYQMPYPQCIALIMFEFVGMIIGAKMLFCFQTKSFDLIKAGFSSYGALFGSLIMTYIFMLIFKFRESQLFCITLLPMSLTYAIGKFGCFSAGCCYGIPYNNFLKVIYTRSSEAPINVGLFPIQLVEAFVFLLLFFIFYWYYKTHEFNIKHIFVYISVLSLIKGLLYYLRDESLTHPFGSHQWICVATFLTSVIIIMLKHHKKGESLDAKLSTKL